MSTVSDINAASKSDGRNALVKSLLIAGAGLALLVLQYTLFRRHPRVPWLISQGICFGVAIMSVQRWYRRLLLSLGIGCLFMAIIAVAQGYLNSEYRRQAELHRRSMPIDMPHLSIMEIAPETVGIDLTGAELRLKEYRGNVVMLVFWASWCGPCMAEVPFEKELLERFSGRPFEIVGINGDRTIEAATAAVDKHAIPWRSFSDAESMGELSKLWGVQGWPTVYLIDHQGRIRSKGLRGHDLIDPIQRLVAEAEAEGIHSDENENQ